MAEFGPQLPPNEKQIEKNDDGSNAKKSFGPSLPPSMLKNTESGVETNDSEPALKKPRVFGPSFPPPVKLQEEEADNVFGPLPPTSAPELTAEEELQQKIQEIEERVEKSKNKEKLPEKLARDEWMMVPPEPGRKAAIGPEMKGRTFSKNEVSTIDSSGWTDSPQERAKKLLRKDAKKKRKPEPTEMDPEDKKIAAYIETYNQQNRPKSLMDSFKDEIDPKSRVVDDPSSRRFDREKDLLQKRIDPKSRQKLLDEAKGMGGRFAHGKKTFL